MYSLQIGKLVVVGVDTDAEEQPRVTSIDDLQRAEFYKVGLMFLIPRCDKTVHFAF